MIFRDWIIRFGIMNPIWRWTAARTGWISIGASAKSGKQALAPGGRLYFEVGIGQADAVLRIMRAQGFGDIQVVKDHNEIPRVVFGTLCTEVYKE